MCQDQRRFGRFQFERIDPCEVSAGGGDVASQCSAQIIEAAGGIIITAIGGIERQRIEPIGNAIAAGETAEQFARLRQLGCYGAQGYGISRPLPACALIDFLARYGQAPATLYPSSRSE